MGETDGVKVVGETKVVVSLALIVLFVMVGLTIITPNIPVYARSFGASNTMIGALISGFGVARVIFDIPGGTIAQRVGPKKTLLAGLALVVLSSIAAGFAVNYYMLLAARFLEGVGSAFYVTSSLTILAHMTAKGGRGRAMSIYTAMLLLGASVGPGIGGIIADTWGLSAPFFFYAALVAIGMVWATIGLKVPENEIGSSHAGFSASSELVPLIRNRSLITVDIAVFALFFTRAGVTSTAALLFAYDNLGLSQTTAGAVLMATAFFQLVTMTPAGSLSDRYGRKPLMMLSLISTGMVVLLIPASSSVPMFWLIMAVYGASLGISGPMAAWAADLTPSNLMGTSMGLYRMISDLGFVAGPLILGFLTDISRTKTIQPLPFEVAAAVLITMGVALTKVRDPVKRHVEEKPGELAA